MIKGQKRTSCARVTEDSVLVVINKDVMDDKIAATDPLLKALLDMFIDRLYTSNDEVKGAAA